LTNLAASLRDSAGEDLATRPFLKWAGGKRRLVSTLRRLAPATWNRYFEPFLGGGALFFAMPQPDSFLSDANDELMRCYRVVRDDPDALIDDLGSHVYSRAHYNDVRALDPAQLTDIQRASRLVFLNRTCFNGLWRVNRRGQFNTPMGRYTNPTLVPAAEIRAASRALQGCHLATADFQSAVADCQSEDLVYFDPPYVPAGGYADFDRYHAECFSSPDHERLATVAASLAERGCHVLLSNSDTPLVRRLYAGWHITPIAMPRSINCLGSRRGSVAELVISSVTPADE